uniref:Coiled-coil and C2 domain containing 2B n=1 Tax=Callorhinchus milii TaxID=7868 RepID=A0A4W3KCC6_CALMI
RPKADLNTIDAIASIGVSWLNDIQKLAEWAKKARIDPHDPQNSSLMQLIEVNQHALQYFRLEQMQEEFNFVTDKEMEKSKRFLLLILRDSGVSEYSYFKQVPPYDKEIPDNIMVILVICCKINVGKSQEKIVNNAAFHGNYSF